MKSPKSDTTSVSTESIQIQLKRSINLFSACALIVGVIVGSGIFVSPKGVLREMGSVGGALIIWLLTGLICLLGALAFAELGTLISSSGGMYSYIKEAFGDFAGFIYLWTAMLIIFPAANAAIALTCAYYLVQPVFTCGAPLYLVRIIAGLVISFLTFVNCASVKVATRIQDIFAVIKTVALVIIIITGLYIIGSGRVQNFDNMFENTTTDPGRIALALYSGLFSYSGWYTLNFLTEELKNPYQNLPRAIWIAMPLVTVIYCMANVAYFAVLTQQEILQSEAVAVTFADKMFGVMWWTMPIFVGASCFGSLNGCILSVSRMYYVGAREGHMPDLMNLINIKHFTPLPAVLSQGIISIVLLFVGDLYLLINSVSFVEALSFFVCTIAMLYFRYERPNAKRPIKVNLAIPILFALFCFFMAVFPIFTSFRDTALGIVIMISGIPFYVVGVLWKKKPKIYRETLTEVTKLIQKLAVALPPTGKVE